MPCHVLQITQAIQFLHDLGSVQHFHKECLKSQVVINPQWIVDAMSCVVSVQNTPITVSVHNTLVTPAPAVSLTLIHSRAVSAI